jgi:protein-S-isoprenylcysteine O-methyltransferase Ste14
MGIIEIGQHKMKPEQALLAFWLLYFMLAFVGKSWLEYRRTGINPVVLSKSDDAYGYVSTGFKLSMMGLTVYLVGMNINPDLNAQLGDLTVLRFAYQSPLAWGLMFAALLITLKAQSDMKNSWRIGIDTQRKTELVTTGLFQWSRNPIYLSMRMGVWALFLLMPNAITLALSSLAEVLMQVQVRLEESHLQRLHGEVYESYRRQVRRWI